MSSQFDYLIDKIQTAPFSEYPFRHVQIDGFLSPGHFAGLTGDPQIAFPPMRDARALLDHLRETGYRIIPFPGCVESPREYLDWLEGRKPARTHAATEGFGIVHRLVEARSALVEEFAGFLVSPAFQRALTEKFGLSGELEVDAGIQKYLHGYEISPHPDIRRKALTWMLNINPHDGSEDMEFHTHFLRLKPQWAFISAFWEGNPDVERDWLPWSWCETVKRHRANNSIVVFAPSNDTIHAVKARYDHLATQRTQMYGNLWYPARKLARVDYGRFAIGDDALRRQQRVLARDHIKAQLRTNPIGRSLVAIRDRLLARPAESVRRVKV